MHQVLRRIVGGVIVLMGVLGLIGGLYGAYALQGAAVKLERDVTSGMDFGLEGLEVVSDTLQALIQTVDDTAAVMDAAVASSESTAETLAALEPAVQELSDIVATDLPDNITAIQDAMPALEQASSTIDQTLRTLAAFEWSTRLPIINYELGFGLGVEYDPLVPLDASVAQLSEALTRLPTHLEGIEANLAQTEQELGETAESVEEMGESLATVSQDLQTISEVIAEYDDLLARATRQVRQVRWGIRDRIQRGRITLSVMLIWLTLSQLAPLYLGCTLLSTRPEAREEHNSTPSQGEQALPPADG